MGTKKEMMIRTAMMMMVVMIMMIADVRAAFDQQFCNNAEPAATVQQSYQLPTIRDNFRVIMEIKGDKSVPEPYFDLEFLFSKQYEGAKITLNKVNSSQITDAWSVVHKDSLVRINRFPPSQTCAVDDIGTNSLYSKFLHAVVGKGGSTLGTPSDVYLITGGQQKEMHFVKAFIDQDRGIPVNEIAMCMYDPEKDETTVRTFYFSDPDKVSTPYNPDLAIPIYSTIQGKSPDGSQYKIRIDYAGIEYGSNPKNDYPDFEITPGVFCDFHQYDNTTLAFLVNRDFEVKIEKSIRLPGGSRYALETSKIAFVNSNDLYMEETVSMGTSGYAPQQVDLKVIDFLAGLQFTMDKIEGTCRATVIDTKKTDLFYPGSSTKMSTSEEYLMLNNKYDYMGEYQPRGFGTYGYATQTKDAVYNWYFAATDFKQQSLFDFALTPVPVRLEQYSKTTGEKVFYDFYDYRTEDVSLKIPDVSSCYSVDQILNIRFILLGSYKDAVEPDRNSFREGLYLSLISNGGLNSLSRLNKVTVFPWTKDEIMVQASVLDKLPIEKTGFNLAQIYDFYNDVINKGRFVVNIQGPRGIKTLRAKKNSLAKFDPKQGTPRGSSSYVGSIYSSTTEVSSYGAGAMAGVGIGMFFVAVLLTVIIGYIVIKMKYGGLPSQDIDMQRFSDA